MLRSNGVVSYYRLQTAPEEHSDLPRPAGTFQMAKGCSILPREEVRSSIDWGDALPSTGLCIRTEGRDYFLSASTASERKIWLQRLRSVRDRLKRQVGPASAPSVRSTSSDDHIQVRRSCVQKKGFERSNKRGRGGGEVYKWACACTFTHTHMYMWGGKRIVSMRAPATVVSSLGFVVWFSTVLQRLQGKMRHFGRQVSPTHHTDAVSST